MPKIWDGTHLFLWQASLVDSGNASAMIAQAKQLGLTGVLIKFADGSLAGDPTSQQFMSDFKRLAPLFKQAGIVVGGWIYQYLTDIQGEVDACVQAIEAGADWIVLDGEVDVANKTAQVTQFGQSLRSRYPHIPIGLSSYAIANYHPEIPFAAYNAFVDVLMPQMYWAEIGWDVNVTFQSSLQSYKSFGKPLAPTGQSYASATPAQMASFVQDCKQAGITGISWWDWQHASTEQLNAIHQNLLLTALSAPPASSTPTSTSTSAPAPLPSPAPTPTPAPSTGASGSTDTSAKPPVIAADVPNDQWYSQAVQAVLRAGLMHVDANNNFSPNQPVTRAMLAEVLYNLMNQKQQ